MKFLGFKNPFFRVLSGSTPKSTPDFPRLYQIQGKTCPVCIQKKNLSWQHFNSGNVMILQTRNIVFVWVGRQSSASERKNSLKIANKFKDDYKIPELAVVDDGYEQSMPLPYKTEWNQYLNLKQRHVHPLVVPNDQLPASLKLYHCNAISGLFRVELLKSSGLEQVDLYDRNGAYIIDGMSKGVWIWIGRSKSKQEKAEAMRHARGYVIKVTVFISNNSTKSEII